MRVHITGFKESEKEEQVRKMVALGLKVEESIQRTTEVLVCESVFSQKYRLAKLFGAKVVRRQWIAECSRARAVIDTKGFELGVFENVKLHFYGFDPFKTENLADVTRKNNGTFVRDLNKILAGEEKVNVVVCKEGSQVQQLYPLRNSAIIVYVGWFINCLKLERSVHVDAFLVPFCTTSTRVPIDLELRAVEMMIENTDLVTKETELLSGCVFYFLTLDSNGNDSHSSQAQEELVGTRLAILMGAIVARKMTKAVTHVVTNFIDKEHREEAEKVCEPLFVSFGYLKDCLVTRQKLFEFEYPAKLVERKAASATAFKTESRSSLLGNRNSRMLEADRYSQRFESFLFENVLFAFHSDVKEAEKYKRLVLVHSGSIFTDVSRFVFEGRRLHYVIPDGFNETEMRIVREKHGDQGIAFLSSRWIDCCLMSKSIVRDIEKKGLINLLPFPHKTPYQGFEGRKFALKGFEQSEKTVLSEVVKALGGAVDQFNAQDTSQLHVYRDLEEAAGAPNAKDYTWVIACLREGRLVE